MSPSHRSKSPPKPPRQADPSPKRSVPNETINTERLKLARDEAERAMKEHKIFTIIGPYPALRESLRRRGWVEKFHRGNTTLPSVHGNKKSDKKNSKSDDDDDDDNNDDDNDDEDIEEHPSYEDDDKIPPWEENDGYYGLLSRMVRTAAADFIWSVRAAYDTSTLNKDQMVNHYSRNGCFTTKVGLCNSLRNLQWFHSGCADEFYPRCYKLSQEDDKVAFIDDYRLTSCISFLRLIQNRCKGVAEPDMSSILAMSSDDPADPKTPSTTADESSPRQPQLARSASMPPGQLSTKTANGKSSSTKRVPSSFIDFALKKVNQYILSRDHEDIDISPDMQDEPSDEQWAQFIEQFYAASHSNAETEGMQSYISRIDMCLKNATQHFPQYRIDGTRNIWILKPGAKSRGRGIVVYDRLEDILKLCSSTLTKDGKFVVQKYIERPLLIHNTKFDIRQWFLVTDWNPLTIWMFKDCYLRFCTDHFSLETRQQNVHLCNYSIQKHYKNNANRHSDLPEENMWTNQEFIDKYLRPHQSADRWDKFIYPAMKDAIVCSMLVAQDTIDPRKNSFELFGADFVLGEELKPWLIEINCSPTMARSTAITAEMCDGVLEDTCKVMIDRKYNRNADTGRFELIYKGTPVPVPIYVGIDLRVEGKTFKTGRPLNSNLPTNTNEVQHNSTNSSTFTHGFQHGNNATTTNNHNNNNNNNSNNHILHAHMSAPPQMNSTSISSSSSSTPAENRPAYAHPASALATHQISSKNMSIPVSLKFRREATQPILSRIEATPSSDSPLEKLATNDNFLFHYRPIANNPNVFKFSQNLQNEQRQKQLKLNAARLSADYLPARQATRSKMNNALPSAKGNSNKSNGLSKINVTDFLFTGKDVKLPYQFPFHRPYQRPVLVSKHQHPSAIAASLKPILPSQKTKESPSIITVSILSMPSAIGQLSTVNVTDETNASSPSILAVV